MCYITLELSLDWPIKCTQRKIIRVKSRNSGRDQLTAFPEMKMRTSHPDQRAEIEAVPQAAAVACSDSYITSAACTLAAAFRSWSFDIFKWVPHPNLSLVSSSRTRWGGRFQTAPFKFIHNHTDVMARVWSFIPSHPSSVLDWGECGEGSGQTHLSQLYWNRPLTFTPRLLDPTVCQWAG